MLNLFSLVWNILKAVRYLAPFLHEAGKEPDPNDPVDTHATENLRRVFKSILWKIITYITFFVIVFWYVVPLTAENKLLEKELREEQLERQSIENRFNHYQEARLTDIDEYKKRIALLESAEKELTYAREQLSICREDMAELRLILGEAGREHLKEKKEQMKNNPPPNDGVKRIAIDTEATIPSVKSPVRIKKEKEKREQSKLSDQQRKNINNLN